MLIISLIRLTTKSSSGKNCQHNKHASMSVLRLEDLTTFQLFFLIEKWSSCGRALDHLESSGAHIMMSGPIVI